MSDLAELVDDPVERLTAEYKVIVNISEPLAKAKLARHIAALANHGGGYIVVGFDDDLKPTATMSSVDRDDISAIVKHYLEPPFQCDVRTVTSARGHKHPIIVVPSHGAVPICTRADGPQDTKGRVQGLSRGAYYIRKPGPASEVILTAAEWAPLIRRCALHERTSILGAIDVALRGTGAADDLGERLRHWHAVAARDYCADVAVFGSPVDVAARHFHFSYGIDPASDGPTESELLEALDQTNQAVDAKVYTGWGMFHVFHGPQGASFKTSPEIENGELEFVETNFIRHDSKVGATDMWRVSTSGLATLLRGLHEDSSWWTRGGVAEGATFSPNQLAMNVSEFVLHAATFATRYPAAARVKFRCEWVGLAGRRLHDYHGRWQFAGHASSEDTRVSSADATIGELSANWPQVAAKLTGPVARAFGIGHILNAEWIAQQAPTWERGRR